MAACNAANCQIGCSLWPHGVLIAPLFPAAPCAPRVTFKTIVLIPQNPLDGFKHPFNPCSTTA